MSTLRPLPGAGPDHAPRQPACRVCGGAVTPLFHKTVLGRHRAVYEQCGTCGFVQVDAPWWLDEAYASPIAEADTGLLARNQAHCRIVSTFMMMSGLAHERGLDWGGGWGVFVRMMRDAGFHFHWQDPLATNLFARGFEWSDGLGTPAVVTAFEVLEHLVDPPTAFRTLAAFGARCIITSTELIEGARPDPGWWYLVPETGQHVAFYRADTLVHLGAAAGYPYVIARPNLQLFAREPVSRWKWNAAVRWSRLVFPVVRKLHPSLTMKDSEALRARVR